MAHYPPNVGIVAIDVYFPRTFVSQTELGAPLRASPLRLLLTDL